MPEKTDQHIFSTRTLNTELVEKLQRAGHAYREMDFIKVEHNFNPESFYARLHNTDTQARIFTSKNSVHSLKMLAKEHNIDLPKKKTFTVGIKATQMLADLGIKASARADNAISLAQIIARNADVESVDFFCGDKSLDDLPEYLESKNIKVNREIVYHTQLVHENIDTSPVKGLIFLSPTAAFAFFKKNKVNEAIPAFCIGATTAEAVRLRCNNPRINANEPSIESVVDKVIEYFDK